MTRYGRVAVSKRHVMGQYNSSFGISAYLQEKLVYVGQKEVYEEASATVEHLMGLQVCAKQIERLCHHWGARCEEIETDPVMAETTYLMVDGSMILTRERDEDRDALKWREMKLARIFGERHRLEITENRRCLWQSAFVAHLGTSEELFEKLASQVAADAPVVVWRRGALDLGSGCKVLARCRRDSRFLSREPESSSVCRRSAGLFGLCQQAREGCLGSGPNRSPLRRPDFTGIESHLQLRMPL